MFTNVYVEEVYESEHVCTSTIWLCVILDAKYEKPYLHKVMETQCRNLTMAQRNELLQLLQIFKELFYGTLKKKDPVDFDLKENAKPIWLWPYPVPKVHEEMFKE